MILLEDMLGEPDFAAAVAGLVKTLEKRHPLPAVRGLGFVTTDLQRSVTRFEARGVAPFLVVRGVPRAWREHGSERVVRARLGIAYRQGVELELIEASGDTQVYAAYIDSRGSTVLHHVSFLVADVDGAAATLIDGGNASVAVRGRAGVGPLVAEFVYVSRGGAGVASEPVLEFSNWRAFGIRFTPSPRLIGALARMQRGVCGQRRFG